MEKPAARGGRCGGPFQVAHHGSSRPGSTRSGSHRPVAGTLTGTPEAHNGPDGPSFERGAMSASGRKVRLAGSRPLRTICSPSMSPIESLPVGLNGLALAWESVAALLGALVVGLAAGAFLRARSTRRARAGSISPERERELESLRRIAAELSRTSDVEGVARALLDEIGALFSVDFVALTFVSDDAREGTGFLARKRGKDVDWWPSVRVDLEHEASGIASAARDAASFA